MAYSDRTNSLEPGIGTQVIRGATWNAIGTIVRHGATLGATIIVARLLSPQEYAIGGLALSITGFFSILTAQGFAQALIQRQNLTDIICHSVFWPMALGGLGLSGLVIVSAPWLARFYGKPPLVPVIWFLSLGIFASMIGSIPTALLQRAMRFKEINIIGIVGGLLSAGLGIGIAFLGYGYWALIVPIVGSSICIAAGSFFVSGYRPSFAFSWTEFTKVSAFGFALLASSLLLYINDNGDYLILGRFWSSNDFGQYYFAFERSRQPFMLLMTQLSTVIFPAFSQIQNDREHLKGSFLRGTLHFCLFVFPLYVLLIGLADPLVLWLFGEQWRPAVPVFQVFAAFAFMRAFAVLVPGTLLAIGKPKAHLFFNIFRAIITLPTLVYLGLTGANILTVSIALFVIWFVQTPFFIGYLFLKIGIKIRDIWKSFKGLLEATIVMGIILLLIRMLAKAIGLPLYATFFLSASFSVAVFILLTRNQVNQIMRQVRLAFGKQ